MKIILISKKLIIRKTKKLGKFTKKNKYLLIRNLEIIIILNDQELKYKYSITKLTLTKRPTFSLTPSQLFNMYSNYDIHSLFKNLLFNNFKF